MAANNTKKKIKPLKNGNPMELTKLTSKAPAHLIVYCISTT